MNYVSTVLIVDNLKQSIKFFETLLGQQLLFSNSTSAIFESGITLQEKTAFVALLAKKPKPKIVAKSQSAALYFEEYNIEDFAASLKRKKIEIVTPLTEQPWGQKIIRFFDPSGNLIEVGEPIKAVIKELYMKGESLEAIAKKVGYTVEAVQAAVV